MLDRQAVRPVVGADLLIKSRMPASGVASWTNKNKGGGCEAPKTILHRQPMGEPKLTAEF